jgi:hypothetical protein
MALPRKLTASEKTTFLSSFPLLDVDFTIVTGEPTGNYNCISWTVGVTNYWHWPGSQLSDFDNFYAQFNLVRKTKGSVAAWGFSNSQMTHGCISGPTHGPCWESKCGSLARIQHCLNELNGPAYGHVIAYYAYKFIIKKPFLPKYLLNYMKQLKEFTNEEKRLLQNLIKPIPRSVAADFEKKFKEWKNTWYKGEFALISDPYKRLETKEFEKIKAMGKTILPLLAKKLMTESNFMALPAFENIAADKKLIIRIDAKSEQVLEGEQGRAYRTIKNYLSREK